MKTCPGCHIDKRINNYYKNKTKYDGLASYCKSCCKEYAKEWWGRKSKEEKLYLRREKYKKECAKKKSNLTL